MLQKILASGLAMSVIFTAKSQEIALNTPSATTNSTITVEEETPEKKSPFSLTGFADIYYKYDFNRQAANNRTSFTNSHNSFELGIVSLKAEHTIGKIGMVADIGFGKRAEDFSYNDADTRMAIKQLYLSYSPVENFKISAGSW